MKILDVILETIAGQKFYAIGDSHAEGIANYGGKNWVSLAHRGTASTDPKHKAAIAQIPKGSTVAVCLGCNDSANAALRNQNKEKSALTRTPQQVAANVKLVVDAVNASGSKAIPVLYPPSTKPGPYGSPYSQQCRDAIKAALPGAIDMEGSSLYDGVHASANDYVRVARQIEKSSPLPKPDSAQKVAPPVSNMKPGEDKMAHAGAMQQLTVPPDNVNPQVADVQKILLALGYKLPKHGVDGVRGPETRDALKQFQKDNGLKVDGYPGQGTIDKLNELIAKKNLKFTKSTEADVKKEKVTAFTGPGKETPLQMDAVTKGKVGGILDFVAKYESRGFYDIMNGSKRFPEILKMTLKDLIKFQNNHHKTTGNSTAAGRYQIMEFNIIPYARSAGLDLNKDLFNEENQDKMAIVFLREKGLEKWLAGTMSDKAFLEGLSRVWAAIPSVSKGGLSYYDKVGNNKAGMPLDVALNNLQTIKQA